jgi:hypothetical protein
MNNEQNLDPFFDMNKKPSSGLNTITILTIIASIWGIISSVWGYFKADKSYEDLKKMLQSADYENSPSFVKNLINEKTVTMAQTLADNKLPIMITGLLGSILCLYGAIEMRKLKSQGYMIWMIGELIPIAALFLLVGASAFNGLSLISILFPFIFIILYSIYKKELTENN